MNNVLSEFESPSPSAECGLIIKPDSSAASERRSEEQQEQKPRYPGAFSSDQPTPFEKAGRPGVEQVEKCADALKNPRDPYYLIQHEKAIHRMMAYMSVRGDTNKEIAEATGYSAVAVSNILRQPATQVLIAEEAKRLGGQEVSIVLRGKALAAVNRLSVELDNIDKGGTATSRIAAANSILDRVFGKANQPITHHQGESLDDLTDEEIAKRLIEIKLQKAN